MKALNTFFISIFIILLNISVFSQSFVYISPQNNSTLVSLNTNIILKSDENIDPSSLSQNEFSVYGSITGVHQGIVKLSDDNKTILFIPSIPFSANEEVNFTLNQGIKTTAGLTLPPVSIKFQTTSLSQKININPLSLIANGSFNYPAAPQKLYKSIPKISSIASLPADFPKITIDSSNNPEDGKIFLANFAISPNDSIGNYIMILNNDGSVVKYKKLNQPAFDFKVLPNGELSYADVIVNHGEYGSVRWIVMDTSLTPVDTFQCGNGYSADLHDFVLLPNGHALMFAYDPEPVDMSKIVPGGNPNATVIGIVIQEVDASKNVVFQWRTWDYLPITDSYMDLTASTVDLIHANAIDADENGNILFSMRHLSSIIKIDRQTGNLDWILGGKQNQFTFLNEHESNSPNYFSFQHDVKVQPDGNITLFDNGNQHSPPYSRAVEYKLDEQNKTADLIWEYRHTPDIYNFAMGSVQKLSNGNSLIGWGIASATGSPALTEIKPDNSIALELSLPSGQASYRAYKFPWASGTPSSKVTLEVLQGNTYKFNSSNDTTGITIKFDQINSSLYANTIVSAYNYAPINPNFNTEAPIMVSNYFNIKGQGITSYSGEVQVNLNDFLGILNPKETIVYARSAIDSNFVPLPTSYDSVKNELTFTTSTFGDFAFGIPQIVSANTPVIISPLDSAIVNENYPVKLVWGTRGVVQTYRLQVAADSLFSDIIVDYSNLTNTSYLLNNLGNNSKYFWRINNSNSAGISNWSGIYSFITAPPYIKILYPVGNEDLYDDSTYIIRWASNVSDSLKIQLIKDGSNTFTIGDSLFSFNNAFEWNVSPSLDPDSSYRIKISSINNPALYTISNNTFSLNSSTTGIANTTTTVKNFVLNQNYPNPFNPSTIISYQLPVASNVVLKIYNVLGREIATLVNKEQTAGTYNIQFSSDKYHLASGVYLYELQAGNYVSVKKLLLLK